ncbi:unnamed protein product, partial [Amoebophrya sp. A25]|eukprot:GSA25T00017858001.1
MLQHPNKSSRSIQSRVEDPTSLRLVQSGGKANETTTADAIVVEKPQAPGVAPERPLKHKTA